jgi:hypothetical protein
MTKVLNGMHSNDDIHVGRGRLTVKRKTTIGRSHIARNLDENSGIGRAADHRRATV